MIRKSWCAAPILLLMNPKPLPRINKIRIPNSIKLHQSLIRRAEPAGNPA